MSHPVELWSVKCFVIAAQELHFGRAAKRLNISQPTLSQQIRKLEGQLGVQLLVRSTRRVELTPSGTSFLKHALEILVKIDEAVLNAKLAAGGLSPGGEQLNIGAIGPASYRLLPMILRRFRRRFPETRLEVNIVDSVELLRGLERGDHHVGMMRPPTNTNLIRFLPLISERFVAVIPRQSPLAHAPALQLGDFVGHEVFVLKRFELTSFEAVYDQLSEAGIALQNDISVSNTTAALALTAAGVGITFLPEWVANVANANVVVRAVDDLTHEISMGIGWRADNPVPGILPFIEFAKLASQSLGQQPIE